jgi:glyoxalase family protein
MENRILGLHHITAIAGDAKRNFAFYTKVLGLRLVKKTVNFDDPGTYHFYFGDKVGTPGTILTFFPWEGINPGSTGSGQATEVVYAVPQGSLDFWKEHLLKHNVEIKATGTRFGEAFISFTDPDGMPLTFLVSNTADKRIGWETEAVKSSVATMGFHSVTLTLNRRGPTEKVLEWLGYRLSGEEGNRFRYVTDAIDTAAAIDIIETQESRGVNAAGTIHHIAFRVKDEKVQMEWREKIMKAGFQITPQIDRNYFYSLYFREPGGVLFEIATDNPGFSVDEPVTELGSNLKLPPQYEPHRDKIEQMLPVLV